MAFNWWNIRSFNNSQNNAFEELVCQLARNEQIPNKKSFYRLGTPDGGVEAYCILNNGEEYGWQAKYFNTMGGSQWNQLEKSINTALEKHPNLVKYYICVPLDRSDPRIPNQNWFMDKWKSFENNYKEFAKSKQRSIEIEYWGSSELIDRLSLGINKGKLRFWFNKEEITDKWLFEKCKDSIDSLDKRYTPELNFELEIAKIFDGIARNDLFQHRFRTFVHELIVAINKCSRYLNDPALKSENEQLISYSRDITNSFSQTSFSPINKINYKLYQSSIDNIQILHSKIVDVIYKLSEQEYEITDKNGNKVKTKDSNRFNYQLNLLQSLDKKIYQLSNFINGPITKLSNNPILLLKGEAGSGKSHLLADITSKRIKENKLTLFLNGIHFKTEENPWTQIIKNILRIDCTDDEFLGMLNSRAEALDSRLLIIIDAINEGKGIIFWLDHLKSFIRKINNYEFLGLIISYRTSYEKLLIPDNVLTDQSINIITHYGFAHNELEAVKLFFSNYKIEYPSTPLLHPEFSNPLFLKLFCEGISKAGLHKIPVGFTGISRVISFFIDSINDSLSSPRRLDYSKDSNLVRRAINIFIGLTIDKRQSFINFEEVNIIFEQELRKFSIKSNLLENLISEGVFSKDIYYLRDDQPVVIVNLAYQRFEDHLTASLLLERHLDKDNLAKSFIEGSPLFNYIKNESECYKNKGLIESFSIQLPEMTDYEFYELAPSCKAYFPVIESFIESLIWRNPITIKIKTKEYINEHIAVQQELYYRFLDNLFLITSNQNHIYNADFLHNHLNKFTLSDRDAWWIPYTQENYLSGYSIKRLIDWSRNNVDKSFICDESRLLICKTLCWLLSSSNRYLRDNSTKAIISLLSNKIELVIKLLKYFENVNDPYILERLYAISYGCALRSDKIDYLYELSKYVFDTIFNKEEIYPNILLRDYARSVIEYSIHIGITMDFNIDKIRPPYKSNFPNKFPTNDEIDQKYELNYNDKNFKDYYWSQNHILSSMTTEYGRGIARYGDFGRYTFESALKHWANVDTNALSNWVVQRVFELGYNVESHGIFDRRQGHGRHSGHNERIGKKYQWIAFYEILARVSDNYKLKDPASWSKTNYMNYDGPWEPYVRDIDPSTLLSNTQKERYQELTKNWWFSISPDNWEKDHTEWLQSVAEFPDPKLFLCVNDPNGIQWLNLVLYPDWAEPEMLGNDKEECPHKIMEYNFRCFLVSQKDLMKIKKITNRTKLLEYFDTYRDRYEVFSREYYWSNAYKYFNIPYYSGNFIQDIGKNQKNKDSIRVIIPVEHYLWEEEYDCSKEEVLSYYVPTVYLFEKMNLRFSEEDGLFKNQKGEIICYDPSIYNKSLECFLVRKNDFIETLEQNQLTAVWIFWGEKRIDSGYSDDKNLDRMEINGLYYLENNEICGSYNTKYVKFNFPAR